jgi:hypothetical protein
VIVDEHVEHVEHVVEVSFGSSLLYLEQDIIDDGIVGSERIPVTSVLFLVEWLLTESWSIPVAFNIPTEPFRKFKDGALIVEHVASTVGVGLSWTPFIFNPFQSAQLNLQTNAMLFADINPDDSRALYVSPSSRIHIETPSGFTLYFGGSYIPNRTIFALMYGVGHRF